MRKIAIIGTHGAGKSTLSYLLAAHYKSQGCSVKIIQEVARSCPFPINDNMTEESAQWIYLEHYKKELEAQKKNDIVIADRSIFDSFIYAQHFNINNLFINKLAELAFIQLNCYEKIIFVRPDLPIQTDGIRSGSEDFQKSIDQMFGMVMQHIQHKEIKSSQIFSKDEEWKQYCL